MDRDPAPRPQIDRERVDRERFVAELAERRTASGKSFAALARELDHPRSTIHGWCRGDHLPYPRDDDLFVRLLAAIGVDDPEPWLRELRELRRRSTRTNPYRGLEPFTEDDAALFCGRETLVQRLVDAVDAGAATSPGIPLVVIGASGSGKTSLLRAGLLARLRNGPTRPAAYLTPGDDPVTRLDRAIADLTGGSDATLVIDQFEELFTLAPAEAVEVAVAAIGRAQRSRIQVVVGVRADFFHHVAAVPYLLEALDQRQVVVGPMSTSELTDAIVAPAHQAGLRVAPDLLSELLSQFDGHTHRRTHALPLLSHLLYRLAESSTGTTLRLSDYRALGGLGDALQVTADETLAHLPLDLHATCRAVFLQLVELRSDTTPTRRRASWDALDRTGTTSEVATVLDAFVRRRLLTTDQQAVTLTHEALITAWPTLRNWIEEQRGELLVRRRIRSAHQTWHETGQPVDGLLRGSLLDEALELVSGPLRSSLDDDELAFIGASRNERDAARARDAAVLSRQVAAQSDLLGARDPSLSGHLALEALAIAETTEARSAILRSCSSVAGPRFVGPTGPTSIAAAPAIGCAVAAFYATGQTERFELRNGAMRRVDCTDGLHPRIHAVALDANGRRLAMATRDGVVGVVDGTMHDSVVGTVDEGTTTELCFDGSALCITISPDGSQVVAGGSGPGIARWAQRGDEWHLAQVIEHPPTTMDVAVRWSDGLIASASDDGVVTLFDRAGARLWSADPRDARPVASTVAISPDGGELAAGYHDGSVRVWNLAAPGSPEERPLGSAAFATWVNGLDFSPDGRLLAAASSDGTVRLWDTATWRELRLELRHPSVVSAARFVADRTIVTSSEDGIVRTWDVSGSVTGSAASIWTIGFDASGSTFVAASRTMLTIDRGDGPVRERQVVAAPPELQMFSGTCTISSDGASIAAGTRTGVVLLIDGRTGAPTRELHGGLGPIVEGVAIVGSTVVAIDSTGRLHRWSRGVGEHEADHPVLDDDGAEVSAGTPLTVVEVDDGIVAVPTEPGELVIVDVSGRDGIVELGRFRPGDAFPIAVARRPGHRTIATGGADRAVSIWSVEDWSHPLLVTRLLGPAGHVMSLDYDPAGTRLAAGTTDGRIWIWDCEDGEVPQRWATIETGEAGVYAVRFAPDGRHLVSAGPHHRVTWWPLDVAAAAATVHARIGDPLTNLERRRLLPTGADPD